MGLDPCFRRNDGRLHRIVICPSSSPKQGWFESNHDYRSRIAHEAREVKDDESGEVREAARGFVARKRKRGDSGSQTNGGRVADDESGEVREAARGFAARKRKRNDSGSQTNGGRVAIVRLLLVVLLASLPWSTWLPYILAAVVVVILCCLMWPLVIGAIVFGVAAYLALWFITGQPPI